mgnify:CR=1 FL=1
MLGLSYAAVPLYDLFCRVTGFGGTTQISNNAPKIVLNKVVSVRFDTNVNNLPWDFKAKTNVIDVKVGEVNKIEFEVVNYSDEPTAGVDIEISRDGHLLSHQAMKICYSAVSCFYDYLTDEGYAFGNPIPAIRKQSAYLIKGASQKNIKRLSDLQWETVLECAEVAANNDPSHERTLFIIAMIKSLYLRVSELSERPNWQPAWKHFWQDTDGNQWLKVLGKGNKIRDISVPNALAPYIKRYQAYRLSISSNFGVNSSLVAKNRGTGGITSRQLRRIVQEAFDLAYKRMRSEGFNDEAKALREATTHWLRHTGASQDITTRPLKHMADDLGHASMGTTDQVYIQSDMRERALSGKTREV